MPNSEVSSQTAFGKIPPSARDLETALLGALMLEKNKIEEVLEILPNPECFYVSEHQIIYSVIRELFIVNRHIDLLIIVEELRKSNRLELAGGTYFLTKITNDVLSSAHCITWARIIKQMYLLREVIRVCGEAVSDAFSNEVDVFELIDRIGNEIDEMVEDVVSEDMEIAEDVYNDVLVQLDEARSQQTKITGVPTNIESIDEVTNGWQKSDLIILAARPSVGKTALALNWAYEAALSNVNVAFFSLEMPKRQLVQRLLSMAQGVPYNEIKNPYLMGAINWQKITTCPDVGNNRIYLDDKSGLNPMLLKGKLKRMMRKRKQQAGKKEDWIVMIDYLQLMRWVDKLPREQEIAQISRALKEIAKDLDVPVIALSQMSRDYEKGAKRKPQLSDLRESGAIEQDADTVMFLSRPSDDEIKQDADLNNIGYLDILKHRSGTLASIELFKDLRFQVFKDLGFRETSNSKSTNQETFYNPNAGFANVQPNEVLPF